MGLSLPATNGRVPRVGSFELLLCSLAATQVTAAHALSIPAKLCYLNMP